MAVQEKTKEVEETDPNEDDFVFGTLDSGKADTTSKDAASADEEEEEEEEKEPEIKKPAEPRPTEPKPAEKKKKEEPAAEKTEEEEAEEDEDIFAEKKEVAASAEKKVNLKKIAKDLDVDLEKDDDEEEFKTKFSEKLEKSKSEFKLDGYNDDAKALIKHLNQNGGDVTSFFVNKQIASMQGVLALDPETKFRNVRLQEVVSSGKTQAEAVTIVDGEIKEMSTREIRDLADGIDSQAKEIINTEVKKIVGDKEIKAAAERQRTEAEAEMNRSKMRSFVDKQEKFLGLELTKEAKKLILRDVENGTFDKVASLNAEDVKFASYMFSKYGTKITKKLESYSAEQNRKGFNAATRKAVNALHKAEDGSAASSKKTGHTPDNKDGGTVRPGWSESDFE